MRGNKVRRVCSFLIVLVLLLCCFQVQTVEAKTKSEVNAKIKTLKKEIKELEAQYDKAVSKEKKATSGTTSITGTLISSNPCVVKAGLLTTTYYWVLNPEDLELASDLLKLASGYVTPTGEYRTYTNNNTSYTCVECKAKKVTIESTGIKTKIDEKKDKLEIYQGAFKEKVIFNETEKITVGKRKKLSWSWKYSGYNNKVTWKSSDKSIATVDKNGKVTGKKPGKVTITATCSFSGKTTKKTVTIADVVRKIEMMSEDFDYGSSEVIGEKYTVEFKLTNISADDITVTSSNPEVAVVTKVGKKSFTFKGVGIGTTKFTVTDGTHKATVKMTIYDDSDNWDDDDWDYEDEEDAVINEDGSADNNDEYYENDYDDD